MTFNDRMRFELNGQPHRCLKCGRSLRKAHTSRGTAIWCRFGDIEDGHEIYRWKDWEQGLPAVLTSVLQVGSASPAMRWALRLIVAGAAVATATLLLNLLFI